MTSFKYQIDQVVFTGDAAQSTAAVTCPDCLSTGHWQITTPGGDAWEIACQSCARGGNNIASYLPSVVRLTIGSVRLDMYAEQPISYMCKETGVGSGRVYYEKDLYPDEESATLAANEAVRLAFVKSAGEVQKRAIERFRYLLVSKPSWEQLELQRLTARIKELEEARR